MTTSDAWLCAMSIGEGSLRQKRFVKGRDTQIPDRIYGKFGTLELGSGDPEIRVNGPLLPEFKQKNDGYTQVRLERKERRDMKGNFIDVIRGKDRLHCNADLAAATMVAIKLGVESYRQRRTMLWDPKLEKEVS